MIYQNGNCWVFFLGDAGLTEGDFFLAKNCYTEAEDIQSLFLLWQAIGYEEGLRDVGERATKLGKFDLAFNSFFLCRDLKCCVDVLIQANRLPETAFLDAPTVLRKSRKIVVR